MGAYENQLRHVAEPQAPTERESATSVTIEDHEALWFTDVLREFVHYGDTDGGESEIAVAYASYIDQKVRDEGVSHVDLYVHTDTAVDVLCAAMDYHITEVAESYMEPHIPTLDRKFTGLLVGDDDGK